MADRPPDERYSPEETQRRFDAALRAALNTPPKPMKDIPRKRLETPKGLKKQKPR